MHIWGLKISHQDEHLYEVKMLLLEVKDITVHYYKVAAVRNISIKVEDGEIATLVGSNGAGKTTTLRAICGLKHPTTGEIHFNGQRIDKQPPYITHCPGYCHGSRGKAGLSTNDSAGKPFNGCLFT